jgi:hypothetical protein
MRKRLLASQPGMRIQVRDLRIFPAERLQRRIACKPLEYKEARKAGGDTGTRTPEERAHLVLAFAVWVKLGIRIEDPEWFSQKFSKYPAYHFKPWERCFTGGCSYLKTLGLFQDYCRTLEEEEKREETKTLELLNAECLP